MTTKISSIWFKTLTIIMVITFFSLCAQVVFPNTLKAQQDGDSNLEYPVLQEKDFQLFIKIFPLMATDGGVEAYLKENNIDEDFLKVLVVKISMNVMHKVSQGTENEFDTEDLAKEFGQSILFNSSERVLFEKYQDQILKCLIELQMSAD